MRIATMKRHLEKRMDALGKERDKLRDLEAEVADAGDHADYAIERLEEAIQNLSEIV